MDQEPPTQVVKDLGKGARPGEQEREQDSEKHWSEVEEHKGEAAHFQEPSFSGAGTSQEVAVEATPVMH